MNVSLLKAARESALNDPDFDMSTWDHCIAGHICKVSGLEVVSQPVDHPILGVPCRSYAVMVDGQPMGVSATAHKLVGLDHGGGLGNLSGLFSFPLTGSKDKAIALHKLDKFIMDHAEQVGELACA